MRTALFALPGELLLREVEARRDEAPEIVLDRFLILRSGRHDLRVENRAVGVDAVAVVKQTARGFSDGVTGGGARLDGDGGCGGRLVFGDDAQRFVAGVKDFDGPNDDAF